MRGASFFGFLRTKNAGAEKMKNSEIWTFQCIPSYLNADFIKKWFFWNYFLFKLSFDTTDRFLGVNLSQEFVFRMHIALTGRKSGFLSLNMTMAQTFAPLKKGRLCSTGRLIRAVWRTCRCNCPQKQISWSVDDDSGQKHAYNAIIHSFFRELRSYRVKKFYLEKPKIYVCNDERGTLRAALALKIGLQTPYANAWSSFLFFKN